MKNATTAPSQALFLSSEESEEDDEGLTNIESGLRGK